MKKNLEKLLLFAVLVVTALICLSFSSSAATEGYYTYYVSNGKAMITDADTSISGDVTIPNTLGGYSVTSIDRSAFSGCTGLTSIKISDTVTSIGYSAFSGCTGLTSITLPFVGGSLNGTSNTHFGYIFGASGYSNNNNYIPASLKEVIITSPCKKIGDSAFYNSTGLTNIIIPDSVTSIEFNGFYNCTGLTSIVIPNGVTTIRTQAFLYCTNLTSITLPDSLTSIASSAFSTTGYYKNSSNWDDGVLYISNHLIKAETSVTYCYIRQGTKAIGGGAFSGCTELMDITIPDSVTTIDSSAFYNCKGLTNIIIPDNVTKLGAYAFSSCTGLTSITIPDSITLVEEGTFKGCTGLTSITVPDSVTSIEYEAFYNCYRLTSIIIPDKVTDIGSSAFYNCYRIESIVIPDGVKSIGYNAFKGCTGLTVIKIPDSVTSIGQSAFYNTGYYNNASNWENEVLYIGNHLIEVPDSITTLNINQGTKSIGAYAFYNCTNLTSVTIPDSVIGIGNGSFRNCTSLTNITIPDSVTLISPSAFYSCTGLTSITIPDSVTSIGSSAFFNCTGLTSITLPFVGDSLNGTSNTHFGYIFGASGYSNNNSYIPVSLKEVIITSPCEKIDLGAFCGCANISSITIPESVTSIGYSAFYGCSSLVSITLPFVGASQNGTSNTYFGYILGGSSYIPESLKEVIITAPCEKIDSSAFYNCKGLTSITIPDSVTSIGFYAFYDCNNLKRITFGKNITFIGYQAFSGCYNLNEVHTPDISSWLKIEFDYKTSNPLYYAEALYIDGKLMKDIIIPEGVTTINDYAFYYCTSLESISFPTSLTSIGYNAFEECTKINKVYAENLESWLKIDFASKYSTPMSYASNLYCNGNLVTDIVIPDNIVTLNDYAFYGCNCLTSIIIPDSVSYYVGYDAFGGCYKIVSASVPCTWYRSNYFNDTVIVNVRDHYYGEGGQCIFGCKFYRDSCGENIEWYYNGATGTLEIEGNGEMIFANGKAPWLLADISIDAIVIGDGVENIPDSSFEGLSKINDIVIPSSVISIGSSAFSGCSKLTSIKIPDSVLYIGESAFYGCSGLESVNFIGTDDCWAMVDIKPNNECLTTADVYFTNKILTEVPEGYIGIYTKEDLNNIRNNLNGNYILMDNIIFNDSDFLYNGDYYNDGAGWLPIGVEIERYSTYYNDFYGTFDGNGLSIVNVKMNRKPTGYDGDHYFGLFAMNSGTIKNLNLVVDYTIDANPMAAVGGICGKNFGGGKISDCRTNGIITVNKTNGYGDSYFGGITGMIGSGRITYCSNGIDIIGTNNNSSPYINCGGIVGGGTGSGSNIISYCYNNGDITPKTISKGYLGGIAGRICDGSVSGNFSFTIDNCYNSGTIGSEITPGKIAGICAEYNEKTIVRYCYNVGKILSDGNSAGIISTTWSGVSNPDMSTCYYLDTSADYSFVNFYGNTVTVNDLHESQMKIEESFVGFDFDGVWIVDANSEYPYPQFINNSQSIEPPVRHKYTKVDVITPSTCTVKGLKKLICEDCNFAIEVSADLIPHSYTSKITKNPTHTIEGVKTYTCNCGDSYTEPVAKLEGHTYTSRITTQPTHLTEGVETFTCECGDSYTKSVAKTKEHTYSSKITTQPTHLKEGVKTFTCACGSSYTEAIAKTKEHSYVILNVVEPTCETEGYTIYVCECGHSYHGDKTSATGHNYNGDNCTICGESKVDNCDCNCHKSGFSGLIWKILRFFYKLFGMNKICACGKAHY